MNTEQTNNTTTSNTKRWVKRILLSALVIAAATAGFKALYWSNMDDAQRSAYKQQRITERAQNRLDLNADQTAQFETLVANVSVEFAKHNTNELEQQVAQAFSGKTLDRSALQTIILDMSGKLSQLAGGPIFTEAADFYDALTPEQQAIIRKHIDK